jgi:YD repeat-containing protein
VGSILTVSNGTWSPTPSRYSYQWLRDGHPIRNATGSSYRLKRTDQGKRISATVTARRKGYSAATATAAPVGPIVKTVLTNTKAPAISGTAKVGSTVKVSTGSWSPKPSSYSYQ